MVPELEEWNQKLYGKKESEVTLVKKRYRPDLRKTSVKNDKEETERPDLRKTSVKNDKEETVLSVAVKSTRKSSTKKENEVTVLPPQSQDPDFVVVKSIAHWHSPPPLWQPKVQQPLPKQEKLTRTRKGLQTLTKNHPSPNPPPKPWEKQYLSGTLKNVYIIDYPLPKRFPLHHFKSNKGCGCWICDGRIPKNDKFKRRRAAQEAIEEVKIKRRVARKKKIVKDKKEF